jgi:oligoribonuclease NrnB/cAMP/cGMP phosphodiesterase (DHH superfamily)
MKNIAIICHSADLDGMLSGVIANFYLAFDPNNNITVIPADYGDDFKAMKLEKYDRIYMLDLSDDWVLTHPIISKKVMWIDHHATAIKKEYKVDQYTVVGVAACRLAYQFFANPTGYHFLEEFAYHNRLVDEPYLVTLAGEYDIWDLESPMAKYLNKGITDISFNNIDFIFKDLRSIKSPHNKGSKEHDKIFIERIKSPEGDSFRSYVLKGEGVMDYIRATEGMLDGGVKVNLFDMEGYAYNTHIATSDIAKQKGDFTMVWRYVGGPKVKVSLYSTNKDVSKIAEKFGGGGHKGACGFQIFPHTLSQILTSKYP